MFGSNGRIAYDHNGTILMGGSQYGFIESHGISTIVRSNNYTTITTSTTHSVDTSSTYVKVTDVSGFEGTFKVYSRTGTTITYEDPGSNASATTGTVHHLKYSPAHASTITLTGEDFGKSIAIGGGLVVIGAPGGGKVYVYTVHGTYVRTITGSASEQFGYSVAVGSGYFVVGAPAASSNAGKAYLYEMDGTYVASVTGSSGDLLGTSVAIGCGMIACGGPGGRTVKLIQIDGSFTTKDIDGSIYTNDDYDFGAGVAIKRNRLFVTGGGYAHVYSQHGIKISVDKIIDGNAMTEPSSIATDGYNVAIGTGTYSTDAGRLHMFKLGARTMNKSIVSETKTGSSPDEMGTSVAVGSNYVVAGCPGSNKVIMYFGGTGAPEEFEVEAHLSATSFGDSVAISGSTMAVGDSGAGKVYLYRIPSTYNIHEAASYYQGDL